MIKQKNLYMANFNCTFGDDHKPMLDYFSEIVFPAFTSGYKKETGKKNRYFFKDAKIIELEKDKYAISGIIVKQTILEVKSLFDEKNDVIITRDDRIPSDPFSYFLLFLENHRMVLVKNQSGSPTLKDFENLAKYTLKEAALEHHNELINISLNIGSLPSSKKIEEQMSKIAYINNVTLKLYPLNGDVDNIYGGLREELMELGCDEGFTTYKNPKNLEEVQKTLEQGKGIYKATVKARGLDGEKITISDNTISSVLSIDINEDEDIEANINKIANKSCEINELKELSEENKNKYNSKLDIIKNIFENFRIIRN